MLERIRRGPQLFRFALSGAINTGATWLAFLVLVNWLPYQLAYGVVYAAGIVLSYFLATLFVFERAPTLRGFFAYPLVYVAQYLLSALVLALAIEWLRVPLSISPIVVAAVVFPLTFIFSRVIVQRTSAPIEVIAEA